MRADSPFFSSELSWFHRAVARSAVKDAPNNLKAIGNAFHMCVPTILLRKPGFAGFSAIRTPKIFNPVFENGHLPNMSLPAGTNQANYHDTIFPGRRPV
jgi:hypothetical protein